MRASTRAAANRRRTDTRAPALKHRSEPRICRTHRDFPRSARGALLYNRRRPPTQPETPLNRFLPQRAQPPACCVERNHRHGWFCSPRARRCRPSSTAIIKSPNDHREYRAVTLPNGLIGAARLPTRTPTSPPPRWPFIAAATTTPKDRAGLAHFLEHMLFLGTTKYPEVDDYQNYITTHGGTFNAYTSSDHTIFFFDIRPDYLRRRARPVRAVLHLADIRRGLCRAREERRQLRISAVPEGRHVARKRRQKAGDESGASRLQILRRQPRYAERRRAHRSREFYRTHYSADQMALVVLGNQSLDRTERVGHDEVRGDSASADRQPAPIGPMFAPGALPREADLSDGQRHAAGELQLPGAESRFVLSGRSPASTSPTCSATKAPGSLHAELKARGWIESLGRRGRVSTPTTR